MDKETLKKQYVDACNAYLKAFCEKHDFDYKEARDSWVGGVVGDVCQCGDFYIQLSDIILDVDSDTDKEEFFRWYDYSLECDYLGISNPNFASWLKGCPRLRPAQRLLIKAAKKRVELAKKELEKCIVEQKQSLVGGF